MSRATSIIFTLIGRRKVITEEGEWAAYLDQLFADRQVDEFGGAAPYASRRELEDMEAAR